MEAVPLGPCSLPTMHFSMKDLVFTCRIFAATALIPNLLEAKKFAFQEHCRDIPELAS